MNTDSGPHSGKPGPELSPSDIERFEEKIIPEPNSGCHLWIGAYRGTSQSQGYGVFSIGGRKVRTLHGAHRVAWVIANGQIPEGLLIRHKCDNPTCCNPDHLELGTARENGLDRRLRGKKSEKTTQRLRRVKARKDRAKRILSLKHSGRTQLDVASELGVSRTLVSYIWSGAVHRDLCPPEAPTNYISPAEAKAKTILNLKHSGKKQRDVALEFGVSQTTVSHIWSGKAYPQLQETGHPLKTTVSEPLDPI